MRKKAKKKKTSKKKNFRSKVSKVSKSSYTAKDIEVLEGLEPVRKRPGMYIGGTDLLSMHHLVSEVLDNAMDEVVAGFANKVDVKLLDNQTIEISDNGRGIPVDKHPKFKLAAAEVIMTTLHSGGKFSNNNYKTSGGLHGVGVSVVNALSSFLKVEVFRDGNIYTQEFAKGKATTDLVLRKLSDNVEETGTRVAFKYDSGIFIQEVELEFNTLAQRFKEIAYLNKGLEVNFKSEIFCI